MASLLIAVAGPLAQADGRCTLKSKDGSVTYFEETLDSVLDCNDGCDEDATHFLEKDTFLRCSWKGIEVRAYTRETFDSHNVKCELAVRENGEWVPKRGMFGPNAGVCLERCFRFHRLLAGLPSACMINGKMADSYSQ